MKRRILVALVAAFLVAQLVPVARDNPPVSSEVPAPSTVRRVLQRACYDCHSNETAWPWYAYVAPVSWLVTHDVHEAREHMNFSEWDRYDAKEREENREEIWEEVEEGEMPLWYYVLLHPEVRLDAGDEQLLREWANAGP